MGDRVRKDTRAGRVAGAFNKQILAALLALAAALAGCGGDSGVSLGDGQSPDPVVVDFPLFYVRKPLPVDQNGQLVQTDVRDITAVASGADLYVRDRASVSAPETNITGNITNGQGDIRDVSVNEDATRVLFAMRTPIDPNARDEDQPTWNIWEYELATRQLRRIITDDIRAEEGHDIAPQYLPDGRIVFSSTRQNTTAARLLDEGKPQFAALDEDQNEAAFVLHVMEDDGSNLTQISFNQSHDLYPTVLANGRIAFARWDGAVFNNEISVYDANPDGTDLQMRYGADSHNTGTNASNIQFLQLRELLDGRLLALVRPFNGTVFGGDLVVIDVANYLNNTQPTAAERGILAGPAQEPATINNVLTVPGISPGGRFASAWPLLDGTGRMIVSWSVCRVALPEVVACTEDNLQDPNAAEAEPAYGIWVYDMRDDTQLPVVVAEPGFMYTDAVVARPRARPAVIPDAASTGTLDPALVAAGAGILDIRSVYDIDGVDTAFPDIASVADPALTLADERPARFLRVLKAVGIPDDDTYDFVNAAFGINRNFGMRELVGYAPVEPDGSVRIRVPADTPLAIEVTDALGRRIGPQHRNWLQVRPGEVVSCNGCHAQFSGESHGRADAFDSVYAGAAGNGVAFPNTDPLAVPTVNAGETMAQARTTADQAALDPSADLIYTDVWTYEPDAGRAPDAPFTLAYADLLTTPPQQSGCAPWTPACRTLINYEQHIQPLWDVSRPVIDPVTLLETDNHRCIDCHALRDAASQFIDPDDRGQLELTADASAEEPLQYTSYRELLFGDFREEIRDGTVQDVLVDNGNTDANGNPVLEPVPVAAPLNVNGANARPAFFARFAPTGAHPGWLSDAELRLIAEWVDLGAQYFNNPFDAPEN